MKFLYPNFLWALALIAIPIIIHLFRFRRFKKIYFSNTTLLSSIVIEQEKQNKIKNLILLIIRILAISFLVFAFSQPYFPGKFSQKDKKLISIYIDNSPSMENLNHEGMLIDKARMLARKIIEAQGQNDEIQILTNAFYFKENLFYPIEDALQITGEIAVYPHTRQMSHVIRNINSKQEQKNHPQRVVYIISDFQKTSTDFEKITFNKNVHYYLLPLAPLSTSNLSIDSCWFSAPFIYPGQMINLYVSLTNFGDKELDNISLNLNLNGLQKVVSFSIAPSENKTIEIPFLVSQTGWLKGILSIEDYPVTFDDKYYFSCFVRENVKVLNIESRQNNSAIQTLFSTDDYFEYKSFNELGINLKEIDRMDFIILNEPENLSDGFISILHDYVLSGGSLLLIPPEKINNQWNRLIKRFGLAPFENITTTGLKIGKLNYKHPLFNGVFEKKPENIDFPEISKTYNRSANYLNTEYPLILYENENPFLSASNYGKGIIYVLSVPLNTSWSNFTRHSLFVPLLYQMALYKTNHYPIYYIIGKNQFADLPYIGVQDKIRVIKDEKSFIPAFKNVGNSMVIQLDKNFDEDGFYLITARESAYLACNYNRLESNLDFYHINELKKLSPENVKVLPTSAAGLTKAIKAENNGKPLWQFLIWIIIALIAAEVLITRFYKLY